jgi:hypothetical protein
MARWRVVAPLVMIPAAAAGPVTPMLSIAEGGILPAGVDPERIGHLLRHGLIEAVTDAGQ